MPKVTKATKAQKAKKPSQANVSGRKAPGTLTGASKTKKSKKPTWDVSKRFIASWLAD
jgi:hypothetical protein